MSKELKITLISIFPVLLFDVLVLIYMWNVGHPSTSDDLCGSSYCFVTTIHPRPPTLFLALSVYIEGLLGTLIMIVSSAIASVFICISKKTFKYKKVVIAFFITVVLSVFLLRIVSMWWFPPVFK